MSDESQLLLCTAAVLALAIAIYGLVRARGRWPSRLRAAFSHLGVAILRSRQRLRARVRRFAAPTLRPRAKLGAPVLQSPRPRPVATECTFPIVLAHGWMGFDAFALPGMRHEYFRGVRDQLQAHGHRVYVPRVSPFAGVRHRAEQFAEQIATIDASKVNIIAHSMGGLDARYAISRLGLAGRVASLTTIGTPHYGTPLADTSLIVRELPLLGRALMSRFGLDFEALHDLTTAQMAAFNEAVPNMPRVRYASYVGWVRGGVRDVHALLAPGFAYLTRRSGDNDGMVPAASQRWGNVLGEVHADHWAQIGWSRGLDAKSFYATVARTLAQSGF
jgi:triacylglycerol lipase